jgi:hypothetical protein
MPAWSRRCWTYRERATNEQNREAAVCLYWHHSDTAGPAMRCNTLQKQHSANQRQQNRLDMGDLQH